MPAVRATFRRDQHHHQPVSLGHDNSDDGARRDQAEQDFGPGQNAGAAEESFDEILAGGHHTAGCKRHGEQNADEHLRSDPGFAFHGPDQQRAKEQHGRRAEDRIDVEGQRHSDAGQSHVRQGVGGERHAPHYGEASHQPRGYGHGDREQQVLNGHARDSLPAFHRSQKASPASESCGAVQSTQFRGPGRARWWRIHTPRKARVR